MINIINDKLQLKGHFVNDVTLDSSAHREILPHTALIKHVLIDCAALFLE